MHDRVKGDHKISEAAIEAELCLRVRMLGGLCEKTVSPGRRGFFDRIVFLPGGVVFFVELKRPRGGRLSEHQKWYRAQMARLDVEGVVVIRNRADIDALFRHYATKKRAGGGDASDP